MEVGLRERHRDIAEVALRRDDTSLSSQRDSCLSAPAGSGDVSARCLQWMGSRRWGVASLLRCSTFLHVILPSRVVPARTPLSFLRGAFLLDIAGAV